MRSLEEILRAYNIVNSRAVSRYTVRFAAVLLLAGVGVVSGFMLITGGPDGATVPDQRMAGASDEKKPAGPATADDPLEMIALDGDDWIYIGYAPDRYDPAMKDQYDPLAIERAVLDWMAAHPMQPIQQPLEPIHQPDDDILMGYRLHFL